MRRIEWHKILTSGFTRSLEPVDSAFDEVVELGEDFLTDLDLVSAGVVGGGSRCALRFTGFDFFSEVPLGRPLYSRSRVARWSTGFDFFSEVPLGWPLYACGRVARRSTGLDFDRVPWLRGFLNAYSRGARGSTLFDLRGVVRRAREFADFDLIEVPLGRPLYARGRVARWSTGFDLLSEVPLGWPLYACGRVAWWSTGLDFDGVSWLRGFLNAYSRGARGSALFDLRGVGVGVAAAAAAAAARQPCAWGFTDLDFIEVPLGWPLYACGRVARWSTGFDFFSKVPLRWPLYACGRVAWRSTSLEECVNEITAKKKLV